MSEETLYIWYMDCSWRGSIVVVASNEEEVRSMMEKEYNYDKENYIEKHEIKPGLIISNHGDL